MTIKELLNQGIMILKNENIDGPKNKARAILEHTLKKSREYLIIYDREEITPNQRDEYIKNLKRLVEGEPLQYITGLQEFMKLKFLVNKDVLIPQPDTEILVEEVINIAIKKDNPVILDLCTGSGAIAISIAKYVPNVKVVATDISEKALSVAIQNAKFNGVINNIEFIKSDLLDNIGDKKFDIIVSNPPYIKSDEIKTLPKDVQAEPKLALDGGKDGLNFYRRIAKDVGYFLKDRGCLALEIGYNQKEDVKKIIESTNYFNSIYCKKDLCQNDRVIVCKNDF